MTNVCFASSSLTDMINVFLVAKLEEGLCKGMGYNRRMGMLLLVALIVCICLSMCPYFLLSLEHECVRSIQFVPEERP